jgi:hypothetical protein
MNVPVAENFSAVLGEAVLGRMTLGGTPYREPGHITIASYRQARIMVENGRQALITIERE